MSTSPSVPDNPKLIVFDTSALLLLIATEQIGILRLLRGNYGVQPAIVQAVESEALYNLTSVPKFRGRQEQLSKAVKNGTLLLLDRAGLAPLVGGNVDSWARQLESEGERLHAMVDRGEAFSHAASIVLGVPIATNDVTAVRRLLKNGEAIPRPIIRFWDLVVLAHQIGSIDEAACDRVRQTFPKLKEKTLPCFTGRSYSEGLPMFYPRLVCAQHQLIGADLVDSSMKRMPESDRCEHCTTLRLPAEGEEQASPFRARGLPTSRARFRG